MSANRYESGEGSKVNGGSRSRRSAGSECLVEAEGVVHLIEPIQNEFTMRGDAFDLSSDVAGYEWKTTKSNAVSCPKCAAFIMRCRGVRVSIPNTQVSHGEERTLK